MKPARNSPCPCGSGKKYKKCCYLGDRKGAAAPAAGNTPASRGNSPEEPSMLELLNNLHKLSLRNKPHIKEYYRIRRRHGEIVNAMAQYYEDGKFQPTITADYNPGKSGEHVPTVYLYESEFDLETRVGSHCFYDMLIYKQAPNASCITGVFLQGRRYRKPEKVELLQSMLDSELGLYEVTDTDPAQGYAYLKEVFTGAEHKITDVGLSGNRNFMDFYIYTRIITYRGVRFGTGLNLIFTKTDPFLARFIREQKKDYSPVEEFLRFTKLYNHSMEHPGEIKVEPNTL